MFLYTVYDRVSKSSSSIFEQASDELAMRQYQVTLQSVPEVIKPDLSLFLLGSYDPDHMILTALPSPVSVDVERLLSSKEVDHGI